MTLYNENGFQTEWTRTKARNITYKKLATHLLNETLCFVSSSVLADSFVHPNRQRLVTTKRYQYALNIRHRNSNISTPNIKKA